MRKHWQAFPRRDKHPHPCNSRPRSVIGEGNCHSQHGGAGLSLGPPAPPVALKLEKAAFSEGAEQPLQVKGSLGRSGRRQAAGSVRPGAPAAQRGRQAEALTSGARSHRQRVNPLSAGPRVPAVTARAPEVLEMRPGAPARGVAAAAAHPAAAHLTNRPSFASLNVSPSRWGGALIPVPWHQEGVGDGGGLGAWRAPRARLP
nr:uncharacterized protein LOC123572503 [Macaca fascicularis]